MRSTLWVLVLVLVLGLAAAGPAGAAETAANSVQWSAGPVTELGPGLSYQTLEGVKQNNDGENGVPLPVRAYVLRVDPGDKLARIMAVPGGEYLGERRELSVLAERHGAVAAVNGGFFCLETGQPDGNLVLDGRFLASADGGRTAMAVCGTGHLVFGDIVPRVVVAAGGETFPMDRVNRQPATDGITLYTPEWGATAPSFRGSGVVVYRRDGVDVVTERLSMGAFIPRDGYLLVFTGASERQAHRLSPGTRVELRPDLGVEALEHLVQGGPLLVENGKTVPGCAAAEGFAGSLLNANPRTAAGVDAAGHSLLVVVDGRQPDWSAGLTFEELAALMVELGAVRAAALDGGGSSTMWLQGAVVNRPSSAAERRLANALLVRYGVAVYLNGTLQFFDVPAQLDAGGRTMVPLRGIFEAVGAEVAWDQETKRVTATRDGRTVSLVVGDKTAYVNGDAYQLDVPAGIYRDRTLVPLRFVGESLGAVVQWEAEPPTVYLSL